MSWLVLLGGGIHHAAAAEKNTAPQPASPWWKENTAVTWAGFGDPGQRKWLGFVKEIGTTICDRGIFYDGNTPPGARANVADYYHRQGLRVTSFLSIDKWKTDAPSVDRLIKQMRQQLDDGCDGSYLTNGDSRSICADFRCEVGTYRIIAAVDAESELFQVFGYSPVRVPEGARPAVAEAIARANYCLKVGKFEMDFDAANCDSRQPKS